MEKDYERFLAEVKYAQEIGRLGSSSDVDPACMVIDVITDSVRVYLQSTDSALRYTKEMKLFEAVKAMFNQSKAQRIRNHEIHRRLNKTSKNRAAFSELCVIANAGKFPKIHKSEETTSIDDHSFGDTGTALRSIAQHCMAILDHLKSVSTGKRNKYYSKAEAAAMGFANIIVSLAVNIKAYPNWYSKHDSLLSRLTNAQISFRKIISKPEVIDLFTKLEKGNNSLNLDDADLISIENTSTALQNFEQELKDLRNEQISEGPTPPNFAPEYTEEKENSLLEKTFSKKFGVERKKLDNDTLVSILQRPDYFEDRRFSGHLSILNLIDSGRSADVLTTYLPGTDRIVAVKKIRMDGRAPEWKYNEQILYQVDIWSQTDPTHENILSLEGFWLLEDSRSCLITQYSSDGNLHKFLQKSRQLMEFERLQIALGVVCGLEHLHSQNPTIIHKNLKSSNIIMFGRVPKICDFGISRIGDSVSELTRFSSRWTAPELLPQVRTGIVASPSCASDIYAFGGIFLEIMTGELPFGSNKQEELVNNLLRNKMTPANYPPQKNLSKMLWDCMTMCWNIDPSNRPSIYDLLGFFEKDLGMTDASQRAENIPL